MSSRRRSRASAQRRAGARAIIWSVGVSGMLLLSCRPSGNIGRDYIGPARSATTAAASETGKRPGLLPETGPIDLTVVRAILVALENNRALAVERLNPAILRTYEAQERAVFDPVLGAEASRGRDRTERAAWPGPGSALSTVDTTSGSVSVEAFLPSGTTVQLDVETDITSSSLYSDDYTSTRLGLTVTQSLLRGAGLGANLAGLRQARLDVLDSEYELRGFAEALVAEVERTYWDYALADSQIKIYTNSLKLARLQLKETQERVEVGKLAEIELAAAQAEVALRQEDLINARSTLARTRLLLLRLLTPGGRNAWDREISIKTAPAVPKVKLDPVDQHVQVARRCRPDLNQARLDVRRGRLEIVRTRNGLLPRLDLFINLGRTGYASSFGDSVRNLDGGSYDAEIGLSFELPLGNRDARARRRRAALELDQTMAAIENLTQLVELDVRLAYIEVGRAREQIAATAATRKFRHEAHQAENAKFLVGKSTSFLVAQAQRDLVASQIAEIQAVVNYLKALIDLHRLEGSLLERRGITAPGRAPAGRPADPTPRP